MAVKWIGDAAHELGIHPLDAVEILASRQEYPMNGLIDEDRFKTLRLMRGGKRLEASGSQAVPVMPERAFSPSTVPISAPAPPAPVPTPVPTPAAAPTPQPAHVIPAPPPVRPPVGEATSVTAPFQTIQNREGERTVILPPVEPKH